MALDLMVLITITLTQFSLVPTLPLLISSSTYLSAKGIIFFGEFMSIMDLLIAFYLILMIFGLKITFVYYIMLGWFLYKLFFVILG